MTNPGGNPMDAVATLMLERQRYEAWLAQLESKRAITPPHVFDRVKGDYERRLKEVTAQLAGRTSEVQATMTALTERLARFHTEETAIRDERYEAELRSHVGELGSGDWSKLEKESDERLAKLAAERTSVTGEIARLQQMLAMSSAPREGSATGGDRGEVAGRPARGTPGFDELEFLKSVTGGMKSGSSSAVNGAPQRMPTPAVEPPLRSSKGVPVEKARATPSVGAPVSSDSSMTGPSAGTSASSTQPSASSGAGSPGQTGEDAEPKEVPSFLRDVPQEQTKTLRCGECSAMNFPSEWYCERCGAELAGV